MDVCIVRQWKPSEAFLGFTVGHFISTIPNETILCYTQSALHLFVIETIAHNKEQIIIPIHSINLFRSVAQVACIASKDKDQALVLLTSGQLGFVSCSNGRIHISSWVETFEQGMNQCNFEREDPAMCISVYDQLVVVSTLGGRFTALLLDAMLSKIVAMQHFQLQWDKTPHTDMVSSMSLAHILTEPSTAGQEGYPEGEPWMKVFNLHVSLESPRSHFDRPRRLSTACVVISIHSFNVNVSTLSESISITADWKLYCRKGNIALSTPDTFLAVVPLMKEELSCVVGMSCQTKEMAKGCSDVYEYKCIHFNRNAQENGRFQCCTWEEQNKEIDISTPSVAIIATESGNLFRVCIDSNNHDTIDAVHCGLVHGQPVDIVALPRRRLLCLTDEYALVLLQCQSTNQEYHIACCYQGPGKLAGCAKYPDNDGTTLVAIRGCSETRASKYLILNGNGVERKPELFNLARNNAVRNEEVSCLGGQSAYGAPGAVVTISRDTMLESLFKSDEREAEGTVGMWPIKLRVEEDACHRAVFLAGVTSCRVLFLDSGNMSNTFTDVSDSISLVHGVETLAAGTLHCDGEEGWMAQVTSTGVRAVHLLSSAHCDCLPPRHLEAFPRSSSSPAASAGSSPKIICASISRGVVFLQYMADDSNHYLISLALRKVQHDGGEDENSDVAQGNNITHKNHLCPSSRPYRMQYCEAACISNAIPASSFNSDHIVVVGLRHARICIFQVSDSWHALHEVKMADCIPAAIKVSEGMHLPNQSINQPAGLLVPSSIVLRDSGNADDDRERELELWVSTRIGNIHLLKLKHNNSSIVNNNKDHPAPSAWCLAAQPRCIRHNSSMLPVSLSLLPRLQNHLIRSGFDALAVSNEVSLVRTSPGGRCFEELRVAIGDVLSCAVALVLQQDMVLLTVNNKDGSLLLYSLDQHHRSRVKTFPLPFRPDCVAVTHPAQPSDQNTRSPVAVAGRQWHEITPKRNSFKSHLMLLDISSGLALSHQNDGVMLTGEVCNGIAMYPSHRVLKNPKHGIVGEGEEEDLGWIEVAAATECRNTRSAKKKEERGLRTARQRLRQRGRLLMFRIPLKRQCSAHDSANKGIVPMRFIQEVSFPDPLTAIDVDFRSTVGQASSPQNVSLILAAGNHVACYEAQPMDRDDETIAVETDSVDAFLDDKMDIHIVPDCYDIADGHVRSVRTTDIPGQYSCSIIVGSSCEGVAMYTYEKSGWNVSNPSFRLSGHGQCVDAVDAILVNNVVDFKGRDMNEIEDVCGDDDTLKQIADRAIHFGSSLYTLSNSTLAREIQPPLSRVLTSRNSADNSKMASFPNNYQHIYLENQGLGLVDCAFGEEGDDDVGHLCAIVQGGGVYQMPLNITHGDASVDAMNAVLLNLQMEMIRHHIGVPRLPQDAPAHADDGDRSLLGGDEGHNTQPPTDLVERTMLNGEILKLFMDATESVQEEIGWAAIRMSEHQELLPPGVSDPASIVYTLSEYGVHYV